MQAFVLGWCVSTLWAVFLVPVFVVKSAFRVPFD